jgi:hypothetical protein
MQQEQIEQKRQHLIRLEEEREAILGEKQRQLTTEVEAKKEWTKERLAQAHEHRRAEVKRLQQAYKDKQVEIAERAAEIERENADYKAKRQEYRVYKEGLR